MIKTNEKMWHFFIFNKFLRCANCFFSSSHGFEDSQIQLRFSLSRTLMTVVSCSCLNYVFMVVKKFLLWEIKFEDEIIPGGIFAGCFKLELFQLKQVLVVYICTSIGAKLSCHFDSHLYLLVFF